MKFDDLIEQLDNRCNGYFIYNKSLSADRDTKVQGPFKSSKLAWESLMNSNNPTNFVIGKFENSTDPVFEESFERYLKDDELLDEVTELDEGGSIETKIRAGKRVVLKKYAANQARDAKDRGFRVVDGKKQYKKNARKEHDNKKDSASDRWKNMSRQDRKDISKSIKKSMKKADRLHKNRGEDGSGKDKPSNNKIVRVARKLADSKTRTNING